ncbi:MAG: MCE family protein [Nocardioidaceae bacterium]|nr:MCE family protein [Nocardioidaceae bacterium]MCL2611778.1 MCE family protein [Nocardioidaceae bacterium]
MNRRNITTLSAGLKLLVFTVVSLFVTGVLTVIMGHIGIGAEHDYKAVFTDASMLKGGDDVRIAGVSVGSVKNVDHYHRTEALVTFSVKDDVHLTSATKARINYLNLVGDRYLSLEQGTDAATAHPLAVDATIPVSQTTPALNLTTLFNGFKPLFAALNPKQVNQLSMNLVQVLQGEGGTVASLLQHTASLTNTLADRDQLIGKVVTNLTQTLNTVNTHHEQLSTLVVELKDWMTNLAKSRKTIGGSLGNISKLTVAVADLLHRGRPLLKSDIAALRRLATLANRPDQKAQLVDLLNRMPEVMSDQTRTGTYGSWYQYYICGISAEIKLPLIGDLPIVKEIQNYIGKVDFHSTAPRCNS